MIAGMITLLGLAPIYVRDSFRSRETLKAEIILLRHQLKLLRWKKPAKMRRPPFPSHRDVFGEFDRFRAPALASPVGA